MPIHAFSPQWNTAGKQLWYNSVRVKKKLESKWLTETSCCDSRRTNIFMAIFLLLLFTLNKSSVCTLYIWRNQKVGKICTTLLILIPRPEHSWLPCVSLVIFLFLLIFQFKNFTHNYLIIIFFHKFCWKATYHIARRFPALMSGDLQLPVTGSRRLGALFWFWWSPACMLYI